MADAAGRAILVLSVGAWTVITFAGCSGPCNSPPEDESEIVGDLPEWREYLIETANQPGANGYTIRDVVQGECGTSGPVFLFRFTGSFAWEYDFFDRESGEFLGRLQQYSDAPPFLPCVMNGFYWPVVVECNGLVITEVLVGDRYSVGETGEVLP